MTTKPPSTLSPWVRKQMDDVQRVAACYAADDSLPSDQRDAFIRVVSLAKAVSRGIVPFSQTLKDDVAAALCAACDGRFAECVCRGNRLDGCRLMRDRLAT